MKRIIRDNYLLIEENRTVYNTVLKGGVQNKMRDPFHILIVGPEGCGKSSLCAEIDYRYKNENQKDSLWYEGEQLSKLLIYLENEKRKKEAQLLYDHGVLRKGENEMPIQREGRSLLLIDDLHNFAFDNTAACIPFKIMLESCNVIATSRLPLSEIENGLLRENFAEIHLRQISKNSLRNILYDFMQQYQVVASRLMIDVLCSLYEESKLSIEEAKEILIKGKSFNSDKKRYMHDQNFHLLFREKGLDMYVKQSMLEGMKNQEEAKSVFRGRENESTKDNELIGFEDLYR